MLSFRNALHYKNRTKKARGIAGIPHGHIVVILLAVSRRKLSAPPMTTFYQREADKVGLISISMNMATNILQVWWNRSSKPGDHQSNFYCMMPEKPADAI